MANFDPQDGGGVIAGCVIHVAPQGDPYATTSQNPGGAFLDTGNARTCKTNDYIRQLKDLTGGTTHFGIAAAERQPIYRSDGYNGPYMKIVPPNWEGDTNNSTNFLPQRIRVSDISATTSTNDIWIGSGVLCNVVGGTSGTTAKVKGLDSGWMYIVQPSGAFTVGETLTWTDNASTVKTCVYRGPTEGQQYVEGPNTTTVSASGGSTVFVACRMRMTQPSPRAFMFSFNGNSLALGVFDSSSTPKLSVFVNTQFRPCVNLLPSHSPQIYWAAVDNTGITCGMGDQQETIANATAVPTTAGTPRIGVYDPTSLTPWFGSGDYYYVLVFNVKLSASDITRVKNYIRKVTRINEPTGLLTIPGYSITAGENASTEPFYSLLGAAERAGWEVRVNALSGRTQSQIRTAILATTGTSAYTAPFVNQSNYRRKVAIVPGCTNDYTATPGDVSGAIAAQRATISALVTQGHQIYTTTDLDKFYIGSAPATAQFRADVAAGNAIIRNQGYPCIDWGANTLLGRSGAAQDQEYFFAGYVHPNETGHALLAADLSTGLYVNGLLTNKGRRRSIVIGSC